MRRNFDCVCLRHNFIFLCFSLLVISKVYPPFPNRFNSKKIGGGANRRRASKAVSSGQRLSKNKAPAVRSK